jgi:hypothetical protein
VDVFGRSLQLGERRNCDAAGISRRMINFEQ